MGTRWNGSLPVWEEAAEAAEHSEEEEEKNGDPVERVPTREQARRGSPPQGGLEPSQRHNHCKHWGLLMSKPSQKASQGVTGGVTEASTSYEL
jgi:hypothetical protein